MIRQYGDNIDLAIKQSLDLSGSNIILIVKKNNEYYAGNLLDLAHIIKEFDIIYFVYISKLYIKFKTQ